MALACPVLADATAEPVGSEEFAQLMEGFAPFEVPPRLAVAVSGGGDSMALALLAADWAQARGGAAHALTVDHGLRPEAAAEAAQVAAWCTARGITHETLRWAGPVPKSGIQEAARAARYDLLEAWCRHHRVLHLLTAHQREDQAETVLMRLLHASGVEGLAGMSAVHERRVIRVVRPVLGLSRARLRATLSARGQDWVEDPSNRNPIYLRAKLRAEAADFAAYGFTIDRLGAFAIRFGRARAARENERAAWLAQAVMLHPAGYLWLDPAALRTAAPELGLGALAAIIMTVSGADYPPRLEGLERLHEELVSGHDAGRSLGGCLILPRRHRLLICREPVAVAPPQALTPGIGTRWDGRFQLDLGATGPTGLTLGALGKDLAKIRRDQGLSLPDAIPAAALPSLAALRDGGGVVAVPALGYVSPRRPDMAQVTTRLKFCPARPLTGGGFRIV
jgi:tRNA(Ile)-lysidine synthase